MNRESLKRLWRDDRGQSVLIPEILSYFLFFFMVTLVITIAMVGFRQAGTASIAHLSARRAGTSTLAAGQSLARRHGAVWNVPGETAAVQADRDRRSARVDWSFSWESGTPAGRLLGAFRIAVQEIERIEAFYAGPPDDWE